jgi:hypothetical protein
MGFRSEHGRINVEVTVKRTELIERLTISRQKHEEEFQQAIALWRQDLAEAIKNIDIENINYYPQELEELESECPDSYTQTYDDIIEMFNMAIKDEIILDSKAFRNFCKDEWDWKSDVSSNKYYRKVLKKK